MLPGRLERPVGTVETACEEPDGADDVYAPEEEKDRDEVSLVRVSAASMMREV